MVKIVWGFCGLIGTESYSYLAFFSAFRNCESSKQKCYSALASSKKFCLSAEKTGNYSRLKKKSDNKTEIIIYKISILSMR